MGLGWRFLHAEEGKRYINTRIAPKPVQEEAKGEGRALHWRRPPVPFPGSNLTLIPGLFPFRGNRDLNQQQPRLSASAYKRETVTSVSFEAQFRTCRSEHRQRSAISSWLFPRNRSIIPRYRKVVVPGTHTAENHDFISPDQGSRSSISKSLRCATRSGNTLNR